MKCRTFKIKLSGEENHFAETEFNKFLASAVIKKSFAEIVGGEYWSILVFYEETDSSVQDNIFPQTSVISSSQISKSQIEKSVSEPVILSPGQEVKFTALKNWRNERAASDGVPPYLIAQNDSLMQIAADRIETLADLMNIKGFGEKRAQKYGEEILRILSE
jgi:superfamily II DNA helicase RecQ